MTFGKRITWDAASSCGAKNFEEWRVNLSNGKKIHYWDIRDEWDEKPKVPKGDRTTIYTEERIRDGDIVKMEFDGTTLSFYINGKALGPAYERCKPGDTFIHMKGQDSRIEILNYNSKRSNFFDFTMEPEHPLLLPKMKDSLGRE